MRDKLSKSLLALLFLAQAPLIAGCEKESTEKKAEPVVEAQPTKEVAPSGALDKLDAPATVIVYGGVDKPNALVESVSELVTGSQAQGSVQLESTVSALALRFGLKDGSGLDATKPVRFAIFDPKANEQPFALALPIKDRESFKKTLPEKHKADDGGNAFSFVTMGMNAVFVNLVDDWAVFTGQKELFAANKAFLVKLIGATVDGDAGAVIDIGHLSTIFGQDLATGIEQAKANMTQASATLPMGAGGFDKVFDWITTFSKELDKVVVKTSADKSAGKLRVDLQARPGTELEKTFKSLGARKLEPMLSRLPADAPAALVASFDPDTSGDFIRSLSSWSLQLSLGQGASDADYSEAMNAYWKASDGDTAIVAHKFGDKLRLSMLVGVRDPKETEASMDKLRGIYKEEGVKKLYDQMGIELAFKKAAYKVGDVGVDTLTAKLVEPKGTGAGLNLKQAAGPAAGIFGEMLNQHFAVAKDRVVLVYGSESKDLMTAWLEDKVPGGLDKTAGTQRAIKEGAPGMFFLLYGSPLAVAQALQDEAGAAAPAPSPGLAITGGATGGTMHLAIDVPGEEARSLAQLLGSLGPM